MRTKYDVGQTVYYFEPNEEKITSAKIEMVFATAEGVFYKLEESVTLPERQVYSCELQCRNHFKEIFL